MEQSEARSTQRVSDASDGIRIRPTREADRAAALALLSGSLPLPPGPAGERRFAWQHEEGTFGRTLGWGAFDGPRLVALRHFMPWQLEARDGSAVQVARAVDTVTDPDYRRRGISRRLALAAIEQLRDLGFAFIFNTPNDQSGPGYPSLGWRLVAEHRIAWRPAGPGALLRYLRARGQQEEEMAGAAGVPADEALADAAGVASLLAARTRPSGLRTMLGVEFLRWRYGGGPFCYRAVLAGSSVDEGLAIVRMRRHGPLRELLLCELIVPGGANGAEATLLRRLARLPEVDVVERVAGRAIDRRGFLSQRAPEWRLVWRGLGDAQMPPADAWSLSLGDLEIF